MNDCRLVPLLLLAFTAVLSLAGCLQKASWLPNEQGGYTLYTQARSIDQAIVRFQRSAEDLCHGSNYRLGKPRLMSQGWTSGDFGGSTESFECDLACR